MRVTPCHRIRADVLLGPNLALFVGQLSPSFHGRRTAEERTPPREERAGDVSSNDAAMLPEEWTGEWRGSVHTYEGRLPLRLSITAAGEGKAVLAGQGSVNVSALKVEDGYLSGRFDGDVGTADAGKREYDLRFSLKRRGDSLNGAVAALSVPGSKLGNALTSWVELRRE